jgi:hypothetical protein
MNTSRNSGTYRVPFGGGYCTRHHRRRGGVWVNDSASGHSGQAPRPWPTPLHRRHVGSPLHPATMPICIARCRHTTYWDLATSGAPWGGRGTGFVRGDVGIEFAKSGWCALVIESNKLRVRTMDMYLVSFQTVHLYLQFHDLLFPHLLCCSL